MFETGSEINVRVAVRIPCVRLQRILLGEEIPGEEKVVLQPYKGTSLIRNPQTPWDHHRHRGRCSQWSSLSRFLKAPREGSK